jgi:hypothetical protein
MTGLGSLPVLPGSARMSKASNGLRRSARFAAFAVSACVATLAVAADWPSFKAGEWQFERTMASAGKPTEEVSTRECMDPTAEQAEQRAMLTKAGCRFSPLEQTGKTYRYSAHCKMGGMSVTSTSVLEAQGTDAYTITIDSVTDGIKTHEVVTARRVGDCKKE